MAQTLLNPPHDIWGFTEVWSKATWDIFKASISIFPSLQRICLLNNSYLTFKNVIIEALIVITSETFSYLILVNHVKVPRQNQHNTWKCLWLQHKCRAFKMSWENYSCNGQRKLWIKTLFSVSINFFISWIIIQFLPTMWEGHHPYLFIHIKLLQNKQHYQHYFTDEELRHRGVKWFIGGHRESLCIARR